MLRDGTLVSGGGKDRKLISWNGNYQKLHKTEVVSSNLKLLGYSKLNFSCILWESKLMVKFNVIWAIKSFLWQPINWHNISFLRLMVIGKQILYSYFFMLFLPFFAFDNVTSFFTSEYCNIKMFLFVPLFQNDVRVFWFLVLTFCH